MDNSICLFRSHCMNTTLRMISAQAKSVKPDLDLKEGTIGIKVVVQGNKRKDSEFSPLYAYRTKFHMAKKILCLRKITFNFKCLHGCPKRVYIYLFYISIIG